MSAMTFPGSAIFLPLLIGLLQKVEDPQRRSRKQVLLQSHGIALSGKTGGNSLEFRKRCAAFDNLDDQVIVNVPEQSPHLIV